MESCGYSDQAYRGAEVRGRQSGRGVGKEEQQPVVSVEEEVESDVEDEARMHI